LDCSIEAAARGRLLMTSLRRVVRITVDAAPAI
jgi:hypothetical protein